MQLIRRLFVTQADLLRTPKSCFISRFIYGRLEKTPSSYADYDTNLGTLRSFCLTKNGTQVNCTREKTVKFTKKNSVSIVPKPTKMYLKTVLFFIKIIKNAFNCRLFTMTSKKNLKTLLFFLLTICFPPRIKERKNVQTQTNGIINMKVFSNNEMN